MGLTSRLSHYPSQLSEAAAAGQDALALEPDVILFDEPTPRWTLSWCGEVLDVMRSLAREWLARCSW